MQLHEFLSRTGFFESKAAVLQALQSDEVNVRSRTITNPRHYLDPKKDFVFWKGKPLKMLKKCYLLFNKPRGYLCSRLSKKDISLGKKSIFSLLDVDTLTLNTLFCVGRLDEDSSGLIILTNDGDLSFKIANPESGILKTYEFVLQKPLNQEEIDVISAGVVIDLEVNGVTTPYKTKPCTITGNTLTLTEGKKREVRRIFEKVGNKVLELKRISIGRISVSGIPEAKFKSVPKEDIDELL